MEKSRIKNTGMDRVVKITKHQQGITDTLTASAYYLFYRLKDKSSMSIALASLQRVADGVSVVVGLAPSLIKSEYNVKNYVSPNPSLAKPQQYDLVLWLRDNDRGGLFHLWRRCNQVLADAFSCEHVVNAYTYQQKHDLSGFEDGTENPEGDNIEAVAIIGGEAKGLTGGSCWALQQWQHDFEWLDRASQAQKESCIGRSLDDNREFDDNPAHAHVKRTAQESFAPEADMWRRSMPWNDLQLNSGLMFSCFATSFYPFEAQLNRMVGNEDGIIDGIFSFSKVLSTGYYFCPPFIKGRLDLSCLSV